MMDALRLYCYGICLMWRIESEKNILVRQNQKSTKYVAMQQTFVAIINIQQSFDNPLFRKRAKILR
jgi:hypothetical protein